MATKAKVKNPKGLSNRKTPKVNKSGTMREVRGKLASGDPLAPGPADSTEGGQVTTFGGGQKK